MIQKNTKTIIKVMKREEKTICSTMSMFFALLYVVIEEKYIFVYGIIIIILHINELIIHQSKMKTFSTWFKFILELHTFGIICPMHILPRPLLTKKYRGYFGRMRTRASFK